MNAERILYLFRAHIHWDRTRIHVHCHESYLFRCRAKSMCLFCPIGSLEPETSLFVCGPNIFSSFFHPIVGSHWLTNFKTSKMLYMSVYFSIFLTSAHTARMGYLATLTKKRERRSHRLSYILIHNTRSELSLSGIVNNFRQRAQVALSYLKRMHTFVLSSSFIKILK